MTASPPRTTTLVGFQQVSADLVACGGAERSVSRSAPVLDPKET